jgi:hypothetical protein
METKKIYGAMARIMAAVGHISKARRNQAQGYSFRGVDDVYQAVQQIMAKEGVICIPRVVEDRTEERNTSKGTALIYRILTIEFDFFADDGSFVTSRMIGEGMDSGDKASNKAMSVAHKYALLQAFCIPTEEAKDPENESHELAPKDESKKEEGSKPGATASQRLAKNAEAHAQVAKQNAEAAAPGNDKVELVNWAVHFAQKSNVPISNAAVAAFYDSECKGLAKREAAIKIREHITDLASVPG